MTIIIRLTILDKCVRAKIYILNHMQAYRLKDIRRQRLVLEPTLRLHALAQNVGVKLGIQRLALTVKRKFSSILCAQFSQVAIIERVHGNTALYSLF